eukprot:gene4416-5006_t
MESEERQQSHPAQTRKTRGPAKNVFSKSESERRRIDRRNYASMQTKFQAIGMTRFGPPAFAEFAQNEVVRSTFLDVAIKFMQEQQSGNNVASVSTGPINKSCDVIKRNKWNHNLRPSWWPQNVLFSSPNAATRNSPRLKVDALDEILVACYHFCMIQQPQRIPNYAGNSEAMEGVDAGDVAGEEAEVTEAGIGHVERTVEEVDMDDDIVEMVTEVDPGVEALILEENENVAESLDDTEQQLSSVDHDLLEARKNSILGSLWNDADYETFLTDIKESSRPLLQRCLQLLPEMNFEPTLLGLDMDNKLLSYHITTNDISNKYDCVIDDRERLLRCMNDEIYSSIHPYRYSTLLHLFLISGAMKLNIESISHDEVLNRDIEHGEGSNTICLMWVPTTVNGIINHVVPLVTPVDAILNPTTELCAIGSFCINNVAEDVETNTVKCRFCLRLFHCLCASVSDDVDKTNWCCCCHIKKDSLTSIAKFKIKSELEHLLHTRDKSTMKYLTAISRSSVFAPRMFFYKMQKNRTLRDSHRHMSLLSDDSEPVLTDYIVRRSVLLSKFKKASMSQRINLNTNVLLPEILAFLIHEEDDIPLLHSRRLVDEMFVEEL